MQRLRLGTAVAVLCSVIAAAPAGAVLPLASHLTLVLDGAIDSRTSAPGTAVTAHLAQPLVLAGHTLAPSGTRVAVHIVAVTHAVSPDVDGSVEIQIDPLPLDGGAALPLRPAEGTLRVRSSAGRSSTTDLGDTAASIFVPYYMVFRTFRKGADFRLNPGASIGALTEASVTAPDSGPLTIATPLPFHLGVDPVHATVTPVPIPTYFVPPTPRPRPSRTPAQPSPSPSPQAATAPPAGTPPATATAAPQAAPVATP